ncbi:MAG: Asp-tRNA(Asn)/Glu-tRNA(Gln) amidotransferase subunit GatA [bacterium]|nr:Asp-tRNA(Asn)/Glu-tRNA(Gln) amidotransferase subunit GatA [bacterium]
MKTISEIQQGYKDKEFSCTEIVEESFATIDVHDDTLHAFLSLHQDTALEHAKNVDEKISKGHPLHPMEGIPGAIKDNILIQGTITTAGSKILENYKASYSATVMKKLAEHGAIIIGKTNLDEFAMGSSTENSAYGPSKNPWDTARVPGGSSGGSAVAVASGEAVFALGTDTGGSIRQPAGLCGVVGLKPTYGQVSRYGAIAMASSLDQIGSFARTVQDATIVYDAIRGSDTYDSTTAHAGPVIEPTKLSHDVKGLRIGIPKEFFIDGLDPRVEKAIREASQTLKSAGATIVEVSLPHAPYALAVYYIIMPAEVCANISRYDGIRYGYRDTSAKDLWNTYLSSRETGLGAEVRRRIMLGTYVLSSGYADQYYNQAQLVRSMIRKDYSQAFQDVDCMIAPTSPTPAFKFGEKTDDPLSMYLADIFTVSANIAGIPAVSLPCGFAQEDGQQLPIGMQIFGKHFDEQTILSVGYAYQTLTDWHTRHPDI